METKPFGRSLAGWCRLGYRLAAVLRQASIFFQRCPLVGDLRKSASLVVRAFWGCIEPSRTRLAEKECKNERFPAGAKEWRASGLWEMHQRDKVLYSSRAFCILS
jgi:hypothetical protein